MIRRFFKIVGKIIQFSLMTMLCMTIVFVGYRGSQPMAVPQAPEGLTYFEFISNHIEFARTMEPTRYGWGMLLSLAVLGPIYATVYTIVGIHPEGGLARVTTPDPGILQEVERANWHEVPGIWWQTLERLSWMMLY